MTPRLESDRFPYLPLRLEIRGRSYPVEALIDTGSDGDVAAPTALLAAAGPPDNYHSWILVDGSEVFAPYYHGTVRVGDVGSFPAAITALGEEPIVGRGVTDNVSLHLDHGRRVVVEP